MKKNKSQGQKSNIVEEKLYTLYITTTRNEHWCKVGESCTDRRPDNLISKYTKNSKCVAEKIFEQYLPHNKSKRLNDKYVHDRLQRRGWKKVDSRTFAGETNCTDGSDEVFDLENKNIHDFTNDLKDILAKAKPSDYSVKVSNCTALQYDPSKFHMVSADLYSKCIHPRIHKYASKGKILLIGQFDDHIMFYMMHSADKIVVWHDRADCICKQVELWNADSKNVEYVESLEEIIDMNIKFDLIIANPPYGSIGANITWNVLEKIDFDEFINLLPMSDYAKTEADVAKHIVSIEDIEAGFEDAAVTTAIAVLSKTPVSDVSADKLKLRMKDFGILNKFFRKNAVSDYVLPIRQRSFRGMENRFAVAIGRRDAAHGHLPYSQDTNEYLFNMRQIDRQEYEKRVAETLYGKPTGNLTSDPIFFETEVEAEHYKNFIYSEDGFRFTSMLWSTYKTDSSQAYEDCFPRVDWAHSWTVEEILRDYNYTEDEVQEVMEDLKNYKLGEMHKNN